MQLDQASQQKIQNFLQSKKMKPNCALCDSNNSWNIGPIVNHLDFQNGDFVVGGPVVPVVLLTCGNCGNTLQINAIVSGIITS